MRKSQKSHTQFGQRVCLEDKPVLPACLADQGYGSRLGSLHSYIRKAPPPPKKSVLRTLSFYSPMRQVVLSSPYFTDEKTVFQVVFSITWGIGQLPEWVMVLMLSLAAARAQDNNPTFLTPCFSCAQHTPWIFDNTGIKITPYCTDYHINICVNEHLFSVF